LDILLPRGSGISFLKSQKEISSISSIPVVVLSNFDEPDTKREALALGAKEYLIKSNLDPSQTLERIKKYL
jgi:DNA-binding NarL/FixJ family response regulator